MVAQPLFLDRPIEIPGEEKVAGMRLKLTDNSDQWPQEITQEAYRQLPYLSGFDVNVILDRLDDERGYGFGSIEISPKTEMNPGERALYGMSKVHIPIVIDNGMLCPFDVFLAYDKYHHLTESKIKETLFRPNTFDSIKKRPPDSLLANELHPPEYGGGLSGGIKMASAEIVPLLPQLHGRVLQEHKDRLMKEASDPSVKAAIFNANEGVRAAFDSAINLTPSDFEKTATQMWDSVRANVVQLRKEEGGKYIVKWANTDLYQPREEPLDGPSAQSILGDKDLSAQLERDGTVTASPNSSVKSTLDNEEISNVDQFGLWSVQDTMGNNLVGWAFPQILSLDMQPLPLILFNNGSQFGMQDRLAGKLIGKSTDIPKGVPRGYGALYYVDHGNARALVPMTIKSSFSVPGGQASFIASLDTGGQVTISFVDGIKVVTKMGEGEYAVPNTFSWMPLKAPVELVSEPLMFSKTASQKWSNMVEILGDKDVFSFRGPAVAKLAHAHTRFLNRGDAEFLCCALGMEPSFTKEALNRASHSDTVPVGDVRQITPASEKVASARRRVSDELANLPHPIRRYSLVKEAALLDDALTVDKILGLGFINAENVASFVDMLPALEMTSSKLAELLLAVRLGLKDVPEVAIERMLVALGDVIKGLKALKQKEITFAE